MLDCKLHTAFHKSDFGIEGSVCLKTVLIVDGDLGFVFWLGHLLDAAGYSAYPAKSASDAALLMLQLDLQPKLLVINPELPAAADFIAGLHRSHSSMRAIGVVEHVDDGSRHCPGMDVCLAKPAVLDDSAHGEWLDCIRQLLGDNALSHTGSIT